MNSHGRLLRRIAAALLRHAASIMPPDRSAWAQAMQNEIHHIERDRAALSWALGAVLTSYLQRSRLSSLIQTPGVRWFLALFILGQAFDQLFATVLTVSCRLQLVGLARFLGAFTPGDDYRRLIPLMNATPRWLHAHWVAGRVLFVAAAWALLRNRRSAFPVFAAAWIAAAAGAILNHAMPEFRAAFSFPTWQVIRDGLIPTARTLLPALVAAALRIHHRSVAIDEIGRA